MSHTALNETFREFSGCEFRMSLPLWTVGVKTLAEIQLVAPLQMYRHPLGDCQGNLEGGELLAGEA